MCCNHKVIGIQVKQMVVYNDSFFENVQSLTLSSYQVLLSLLYLYTVKRMHANLGITVLAKVNLTIMLIPHLKKKNNPLASANVYWWKLATQA